MFALWSSPNHIPIKSKGLFQKMSQSRPIYLSISIFWYHWVSINMISLLFFRRVGYGYLMASSFPISFRSIYHTRTFRPRQHCLSINNNALEWYQPKYILTRVYKDSLTLAYPSNIINILSALYFLCPRIGSLIPLLVTGNYFIRVYRAHSFDIKTVKY